MIFRFSQSLCRRIISFSRKDFSYKGRYIFKLICSYCRVLSPFFRGWPVGLALILKLIPKEFPCSHACRLSALGAAELLSSSSAGIRSGAGVKRRAGVRAKIASILFHW